MRLHHTTYPPLLAPLYGARTRKRDNRGVVHARKRDNRGVIHARKRDIGT